MGFDFNFRLAEDIKDRDKLARFLLKQPLGYPQYEDWVERARQDLERGWKSSVLAFSNGMLVGDLVFQPHKDFPRIRELKNVRVHPKLQGRYFAQFMIRQAEREDLGTFEAIMCDSRSDQTYIRNTLRFCGYEELFRIPLYDTHVEDIVHIKRFDFTPEGIFAPVKKKMLSNAC